MQIIMDSINWPLECKSDVVRTDFLVLFFKSIIKKREIPKNDLWN